MSFYKNLKLWARNKIVVISNDFRIDLAKVFKVL